MKLLRTLVVASLVIKMVVLGTWWAGTVRASSPAEAADAEAAGEGDAAKPGDVMARSRGFREVLDAVAARNKELEAREQALTAREAGLAALEASVAEQVARLETPGTAPAPTRQAKAAAPKTGAAKPAAAGAAPRAEGAQPEVTRVYESMKPDEAAPILDRLDDETLRLVLGRMKERQVGALLAAMTRERAVAVTKMLADGPAGADAGGDGAR
ncbi:MAG TPA: hypothetical protein VGR62_04745 [Candidatus Binatia bacterium]|jgi:flagellar motility protein MotE (MotC chaperone)|nr:hypothetical protein [Candidatus Binatia bacterium]